jgi:serine/threonine protein kinase
MMQPPPELVLDRYRVGSRLAAGAAGTVVGAVDTEDERAVVVKFFDGSDDNFAAWVQEVRLAMRLRHPNIPACVNAGYDPAWGLSVLVFERALGGSLRRALVSGRSFTVDDHRRVLADVAAALVHAHAQGVIHRDVKPENILAQTAEGAPPWQLTLISAPAASWPAGRSRGRRRARCSTSRRR